MKKDFKPIIFLGVIIVAAAAFLFFEGKFQYPRTGAPETGIGVGISNEKETNYLLPTVEGGNRKEITQKIQAPDAGTSAAPENVAVPVSSVKLSGENGTAALRSFNIKGEGGKFAPSIIVVNEFDIIDIKFTAVDRDYSVSFPDFGVYRKAAKGETVKIQFQAYPFGEYTFFCKDVCASDISGKIIVNKKQ